MLTLSSALVRAVNLFGARTAIVDDEGTCNWREFVDRVARAATVLQDLGVRRGDRFAILSRNTFRHAELMHAGYWMGAIPVPVNIRLAAPEIRYILDDAECKMLAVEDELWRQAQAAELTPWRNRRLHVSARDASNTGGEADSPNYEALLANASPAPRHDCAEDDDAVLLYTGGTTGRSKGVRLSHKNVIANGMQMAVAFEARADDIFLHIPPMFHSADLLGTAFTLVGGAHAYLPQFSGQATLAAIERHGVTVSMLAPTMIIMTLQEDNIGDFDLSSFRTLFYGSSPMAVEWIRSAMEAFPGAGVQQGYGLTETSPILTTLDPDVHRRALASGDYDILKAAGRPLIGVDLCIIDEDGNEVPVGEVGEVVIRGPNVTKGYLNRPDDNARAFRDGWFHTGDVGRVDGEGYLYLMDRKKDMIITGGENVYSSEVEAVLYQHDNVFEAAVVGVPDERYGEALFAVIVPAPGTTLTEEEIIEHCRGRIGGYKIPRRMAFVKELPKSALGKILKTELRRIYSEQKQGIGQ
ncbi:MAG: class I adenylate-forming enzyme family protein [Sphingomonadales bacterium]